ncbi:unnamed protein product [Amoebophrya sp. A120]|nr:unnamed protein product [Amoebophrya sp. A120]|eukprot:GSA120T00016832001.1
MVIEISKKSKTKTMSVKTNMLLLSLSSWLCATTLQWRLLVTALDHTRYDAASDHLPVTRSTQQQIMLDADALSFSTLAATEDYDGNLGRTMKSENTKKHAHHHGHPYHKKQRVTPRHDHQHAQKPTTAYAFQQEQARHRHRSVYHAAEEQRLLRSEQQYDQQSLSKKQHLRRTAGAKKVNENVSPLHPDATTTTTAKARRTKGDRRMSSFSSASAASDLGESMMLVAKRNPFHRMEAKNFSDLLQKLRLGAAASTTSRSASNTTISVGEWCDAASESAADAAVVDTDCQSKCVQVFAECTGLSGPAETFDTATNLPTCTLESAACNTRGEEWHTTCLDDETKLNGASKMLTENMALTVCGASNVPTPTINSECGMEENEDCRAECVEVNSFCWSVTEDAQLDAPYGSWWNPDEPFTICPFMSAECLCRAKDYRNNPACKEPPKNLFYDELIVTVHNDQLPGYDVISDLCDSSFTIPPLPAGDFVCPSAAVEEARKKDNNKLMIILAVVGAVVLLGAGVTVFLMRGDAAAVSEVDGAAEADEAAGKNDDNVEGKPAGEGGAETKDEKKEEAEGSAAPAAEGGAGEAKAEGGGAPGEKAEESAAAETPAEKAGDAPPAEPAAAAVVLLFLDLFGRTYFRMINEEIHLHHLRSCTVALVSA